MQRLIFIWRCLISAAIIALIAGYHYNRSGIIICTRGALMNSDTIIQQFELLKQHQELIELHQKAILGLQEGHDKMIGITDKR